jgi:hypothetical protein
MREHPMTINQLESLITHLENHNGDNGYNYNDDIEALKMAIVIIQRYDNTMNTIGNLLMENDNQLYHTRLTGEIDTKED